MKAKIGIILGSGLHNFSEELSSPKTIYEDCNSFHDIKIQTGNIRNKEIVLFSGRRHFYEGFENNEIFQNVNYAKELGVGFLILSNAAGGINKMFRVSDIMLITSHYNFIRKKFAESAVSDFYHKHLIEQLKASAEKNKIILRTGSYCCMPGPMYETKSEIRFLSKFGIDAVGMSTIPEMIHAVNYGIKTIALSCITNLLSENSTGVTNHDEVLEAGKNSYIIFSSLIKNIISDFSD